MSYQLIKMFATGADAETLSNLPKAEEFFNMGYHLAFEKADNENDMRIFSNLLNEGFEGCIDFHISKTKGVFDFPNYEAFMKEKNDSLKREKKSQENFDKISDMMESLLVENKELKHLNNHYISEVAALEEDRDLYKNFYEEDMKKGYKDNEELKYENEKLQAEVEALTSYSKSYSKILSENDEKDKMIKDFDIICEKKDDKLKLQAEKIDLAYQMLRDMKHLSKKGDLVSLSEIALGYSAKDIKHKYVSQWGLIVSCYNDYRVEEEQKGCSLDNYERFVDLIGSILDTEKHPKIKKVVKKKRQIGGVKNLLIDIENEKKEEEMGAEIVKDYSAEELYPQLMVGDGEIDFCGNL